MIILWTIGVIVFLILFTFFLVLLFQAKEIIKKEEQMQEALWQRRNRIPLLLEAIARGGITSPSRTEIIKLRAEVSSARNALFDEINLEKQITKLSTKLFMEADVNPELKRDALFLSLKKEFADVMQNINAAQNDYRFSLEKWQKNERKPLFKIFTYFPILRDLSGKNLPPGQI